VYEGECFCGAIAYRVDGELIEPRSCHCSRCRKTFGGSGSAYAEVVADEFAWVRGASGVHIYGDVERRALGFCEQRGSTLCAYVAGHVHGITLGTLNGMPPLTITRHVFVASEAPSDVIGGSAPQYAAAPGD
jgi:hypothetical protein